MQDVTKILDLLNKVGNAASPILLSPDVLRAILLDKAVKQYAIDPLPAALTEPIPDGVIHSIHGAIAELAHHCTEIVIVAQTILAAHDRLHANTFNLTETEKQ